MYVILSIIFIILLLFFIAYGWGIVMRRSQHAGGEAGEKCSLCREKFPRDTLVEREVGDYKLLYFCNDCIQSLSKDAYKLPVHDHQAKDNV